MAILHYIALMIVLSESASAEGISKPAINTFEYYSQLNEKEKRLEEYKDNDEALKLKLSQLELINSSRKKHRVPPVGLDILASRVANKMAREAAENRYTSHWNLAGETPYHRYAFAGGYDHVSENVFGEWTTGRYNGTSSEISDLMKKGHLSFMAERAPADGHKKNIIDKAHNFVGLGYFITDNQFRYYEEFINRYFEFENVPSSMRVNETGYISFTTDGVNYPYYLIAFFEEIPKPLKPDQLNRKGSYNDFTNTRYQTIPAWEIAKFKSGTGYRIPLKFNKKGLYYIHIYFDKKEITTPTSLNTKGKTIGSGIVIRVDP
jgi:uncharacterized protein YkwD